MISKVLFPAIVAFALSLAGPAQAATYNASFDGSVFDVVAQITTDGANNVTAISGTVVGINGASIGGLVPLGNDLWEYDNKFFASSPYVSDLGIVFSAGTFLYNLYSENILSGSVAYFLSTFNPDGSLGDPDLNGLLFDPGDTGTLTVAQTPLPGAIWLFGSVLAGLTGLMARRRRASPATSRPPLLGAEVA
jgi:hypothetical protein